MTDRFIHPEAAPDEVWIGNVFRSDFPMIGWTTKRIGTVTYDSYGEKLSRHAMKPVFVKREEIAAAGIPIPNLGPVDFLW